MLLETVEVEVDVSRNDSNTPQNNETNIPLIEKAIIAILLG